MPVWVWWLGRGVPVGLGSCVSPGGWAPALPRGKQAGEAGGCLRSVPGRKFGAGPFLLPLAHGRPSFLSVWKPWGGQWGGPRVEPKRPWSWGWKASSSLCFTSDLLSRLQICEDPIGTPTRTPTLDLSGSSPVFPTVAGKVLTPHSRPCLHRNHVFEIRILLHMSAGMGELSLLTLPQHSYMPGLQ